MFFKNRGLFFQAKLFVSFFCIYVFWGGTFLARKAALETLPPFLLAGTQFTLAGVVMGAGSLLSGFRGKLSKKDIFQAALPGVLILSCGTGLLAWAQQKVPSGIASLLTASVPLWMTALEHVKSRTRIPLQGLLGISAGMAGIYILVLPEGVSASVDPAGACVLLLAAFLWSLGSFLCRDRGRHLPEPVWLSLQLVWGGLFLLAMAVLSGEAAGFSAAHISGVSALAFAYLVMFGGIAGFIAYAWLLRYCSASSVATHAFVNPLIAVLLGWAVGGEQLNALTSIGGALILGAVLLILPLSRNLEAVLDENPGKSKIDL